MKLSKFIILILCTFCIALAFIVGVKAGRVKTCHSEPETVTVTEYYPIPTVIYNREEIGGQIDKYRKTGDLDIIADFYNEFVENMELTYLILSAAQVYEIPENVLFALIWAESDFNPGASNGRNNNGTNDAGLMQLNSQYFKGFDRKDPVLNLRYGCEHLRSRYIKYSSWDAAIMYYNGFSQKAVEHQARVLAIERRLDRCLNYLLFERYT